jgi:hypothetical protein
MHAHDFTIPDNCDRDDVIRSRHDRGEFDAAVFAAAAAMGAASGYGRLMPSGIVPLAMLALGETLLSMLFAGAIDLAIASAQPPFMPLLAAGGCTMMMAAALLLACWARDDRAREIIA